MASYASRLSCLASKFRAVVPLSRRPVNGQFYCGLRNTHSQPPQLPKRGVKQNISLVSWRSVSIFGIVGAGLLGFMWHVQGEKEAGKCLLLNVTFLHQLSKCNLFIELAKERTRKMGKASIGGKWELIDTDGKLRKSEDFHGKWVLIYFGFTHCPDVCPDELEKMSGIVEDLSKFVAIAVIYMSMIEFSHRMHKIHFVFQALKVSKFSHCSSLSIPNVTPKK